MLLSSKDNGWTEIFRLISPILLGLVLFILSGIKSDVGDLKVDIKDLDGRVFKHLTNDEIHVPRGTIVTDAEFKMHAQFENEKMEMIVKALQELSQDIRRER